MQNDVMVSVFFITYNHKEFIKRALDGIVMQKTNFKFEVVTYDDCSTDGTREIVLEYIEKYPDLFVPILPDENRAQKEGFHGINMDIYSKCQGKYMAFCEGDDYWTDENKLQIQVDYMEAHPDFSGCFHKSLRKDVLANKDLCYMPTSEQLFDKTEFDIYDVQKGYFIETVSSLYRWDIYKQELTDCFPEKIINGDSYLINFFAIHGKIGYIDKLMSVKNIGNQGVWNSQKENEDDRNVKFANEIINFRIAINKLFERYNLNLRYGDTPSNALKRIINSALNKKRYDIIESVSRNFPDIVRELLNNSKEESHLKGKLKKYKKLTNIFIVISVIMLVIIAFLFLKEVIL